MERLSWLPTSPVISAAILMLVIPFGCSEERDGPPRYGLAGKVTLNGVPVRSGMLTLAPDSRESNDGPGTMIPIGNGEYEVGSDRGVVGGPHIVQFSIYSVGEATDGEEANDDDDESTLMMTVEADLPAEGGTYDFELSSRWKPSRR